MRIMFGMFLFALWVFSTQKCEAVMFVIFGSACVHARPLNYLDVPVLLRARAPCPCACIMHAQHNVTRVHINVNHVIMMSLAFTFHSCQLKMRWHDVIGVSFA